MNNSNPKRRILLGQIGSAHGIRGHVSIRTYTEDPEAIATYGPLMDKSGRRLFKIKIVRVTEKGVVAQIDGVSDRNAAEALRNEELYIDRSQLPATDAAEYYHADLIGLITVDELGQTTGRIIGVYNFGAGDLLEVQFDAGDTEFIPFSDACVPNVDLDAGVVTIMRPLLTGDAEPDVVDGS